MFCGSELRIRWWSGKWWSGKLLSVWRMWMLHLDRPCGNVGTRVEGGGIHLRASADLFKLICAQSTDQKRTAFSSNRLWGSHRLNIDFLPASDFRAPKIWRCYKNGRRKSEPKKTNSNWIWRHSKLLTFTFGVVTYVVHFAEPINEGLANYYWTNPCAGFGR